MRSREYDREDDLALTIVEDVSSLCDNQDASICFDIEVEYDASVFEPCCDVLSCDTPPNIKVNMNLISPASQPLRCETSDSFQQPLLGPPCLQWTFLYHQPFLRTGRVNIKRAVSY